MSKPWINLRVFYWHLQIGPDKPIISISRNSHWHNTKWTMRNFIQLY